MLTKQQFLLRCALYVGGTLVAMAIAFVLPVAIANLILFFRGDPGPHDFNGLLLSSYCFGFVFVLIAGLAGLHITLRFILSYLNADTSGYCLRCNYPLKNLPTSSITCPECGFVILSSDTRRAGSA